MVRFFHQIHNSINARLLLVNLIGVILATAVLSAFSISMVRTVFQMRYEEKLQTPGHIFLSQYTYKDIMPYIERLREHEDLAAQSRQYLLDREYVSDIEKGNEVKILPADYYEAKGRMEKYVNDLSQYKDEKYYTIKKRMLELRVGVGMSYFYIFTDLGVPDTYFQVFDAMFQGDATGSFGEDYGIPYPKLFYKEAAEAYRTGETVIVSNSTSDEHHPMQYYSFRPVKDEYGDVIAIIGTDINMQSLETQMQSFLTNTILIIIMCAALLLFVLFFILRRIIVKPLQKLTAISRNIAAGNIDVEVPAWISSRTDEMGVLGKSYTSMRAVFLEMLHKTDVLIEAAISGRLDVRSDSSKLGGLFAQATNKTNDMLDIIGSDFDNIPGAFAILSADYDIVFTNSHFKHIFAGYDDKAIYQAVLETGDDDENILKKRLAEYLEQGDYSALAWLEPQNDERRCLSFLCSRRAARDGKSNGAIIVAMDATELVTAKDKALSANKAKSEFLSRVSHELRTPLNVILSMAKLGMNDKQLEESTERFDKIVASSSHLANIINDVLEMSRMESGKTEIKQEPMDLRKTVTECSELLSVRAQENNIDLICSIDRDIPEVLTGDEFRIRQILINLLSNAVKFTEKGQVTLDAKIAERGEDKCSVEFSVTDTGIGMSDEFLNRLFDPFEQEDSFLNRRYEGSGLGLAISNSLVELMGGSLKVESELGKGSRFSFVISFKTSKTSRNSGIKVEDEAETSEGAPAQKSLAMEGKRILLVDDIDINRTIVAEVLKDEKVEIEEADDGEEAVGKYINSPVGYYDCVLMDIQMPKMDGYTATGAIRESGRADSNIPIIAMTANALKEDKESARAAGMSDHIAKPIDFDICIKKISQWCQAPSLGS